MFKKLHLSTKDKKGNFYTMFFDQADKYRDYIMNLELIEKPEIIVYGRKCHQNRHVKFFSDTSTGYKYSGKLTETYPLTEELQEILDYINTKMDENYNGILINKYMDGNDSIGAHSDDEKTLGNNGVVGIVFGATRKLRIRDKERKLVKDILVPDGCMYHMQGTFNNEFMHEIPVEKKIIEPRVSLTFRRHLK